MGTRYVTLAPAVPAVPAGPRSGSAWTAEAFFTELYTLHYRKLVRSAWLLVRDEPTAEEVVQDAFVSVNEAWHQLKDADKALAYVRQAVVNRSRSVLRHQVVIEKYQQAGPPDMPSAEHGALVSLEQAAVVAALQRLSARQREVMVLRFYADLPEGAIAEAMGISRGAVKSHMARGMAALRAALAA